MRYDFLIVALLFSMGALLFIVALFSLTRRELMLGFILLGLLALANCFFLFGYAGFILADSETPMLMFNHIQYIGIPFIFVIWYFISLQQKTRMRMLPMKKLWMFLIIPVFAVVANLLYPWKAGVDPSQIQQLYFISHTVVFETSIGSGFDTIIYVKGPMYYVLMSFNIVLTGFSAINYFSVYRKSAAVYKRNLLILLVASLILMVMVIIPMSRSKTALLDSSPLICGVFALLLLMALYKYEFFDLLPYAYRSIFQAASFPIFILDKSDTLISANNAAREVFKSHLDFREIMTIDNFDEIDTGFAKSIRKNGECEIKVYVNGEIRYYRAKLETLESTNKRHIGYVLPFTDITDHKLELRQMEMIATYDDLTRIYNRRVFYKMASVAFDDAVINKSPFSFIMFDLDNFKEVNDIYGHQAGDHVLQEIAHLFSDLLLANDIFARYGGEEFIIYCREREPQDALRLAEFLRKTLEERIFEYDNHKIRITASFGVSGSKKQVSKSFEHYIKDSDDGLYLAKNKGKNRVVIVT